MTSENDKDMNLDAGDAATEEVKLNDSPAAEEKHETRGADIDLKQRDPHGINAHVEVKFEDIFAEPEEEIHSFDNIWCSAHKLFTTTKTGCYRVTSLVLGLPLAICWGVIFACLAFCNNFCYMPCFRCCKIELYSIKMIWTACLDACYIPCYKAIGYIFSNIRINLTSDSIKLPK